MEKQALVLIDNVLTKISHTLQTSLEIQKRLSSEQQNILSQIPEKSIIKSLLIKSLTINSWMFDAIQNQKNINLVNISLITEIKEYVESISQVKYKKQIKANQTSILENLDKILLNIHKVPVCSLENNSYIVKQQNIQGNTKQLQSNNYNQNIIKQRDQLMQQNARLIIKIEEQQTKRKQLQSKLIQLLKQQKTSNKMQNIQNRIISKIQLSKPNIYFSPSKFQTKIKVNFNLQLENQFLKNQVDKLKQTAVLIKNKHQNQKIFLHKQIQKLQRRLHLETKTPRFSKNNIFKVVDNIQQEIQEIKSERLQNQQILDHIQQKLAHLKLIKRAKSRQNFKQRLKRSKRSIDTFENSSNKVINSHYRTNNQFSKIPSQVKIIDHLMYTRSKSKSNPPQLYQQIQSCLPVQSRINIKTRQQSGIIKKYKRQIIKRICQNPQRGQSQIKQTQYKKNANKQYKMRQYGKSKQICKYYNGKQEPRTSDDLIEQIKSKDHTSFFSLNPETIQCQRLYPSKSHNRLLTTIY